MREAGIPVIGGFHTSIEKDCLEILLRGTQPVVVCPARGIGRMRPPPAWKAPIAEGRLLLRSPFDDAKRRVTAKLAVERNRFVVGQAAAVLIVHAAPGGQTESLARDAIARGKPVLTLSSPHNAHLAELGPRIVDIPNLADAVRSVLGSDQETKGCAGTA